MQVFILQTVPAKNWTKPKPKNSATTDRALEVVPGHTGELPVRIRAVTYRCCYGDCLFMFKIVTE